MPCPLPILALAKAVRGAPAGERLELLATDPAVESDLRAFCAATGHSLEWIRREGDMFRAEVCVRGGG